MQTIGQPGVGSQSEPAAKSAVGTTRRPTMLGIKSGHPALAISQEDVFENLFKHWFSNVPNAKALFESSRVKSRYHAWDVRTELGWPYRNRTMKERMQVFEDVIVDMCYPTMEPLVAMRPKEKITSFVMGCCTGYCAPTPEVWLAKKLGLRTDTRRTFVGHMGCNGFFNTLKVSMDSLYARPDELVLMNNTEMVTLHWKPLPSTEEQVVVHALFGDATCSLLLGMEEEGAGVQFLRTHSEQVWDTEALMTWRLGDEGFFMTLSPYVPYVLKENVREFVRKMIEPAGLTPKDIDHWVLHPGGPKILEFIAEELEFPVSKLDSSFKVLAEYGNCSSPTVAIVLEEEIRTKKPKPGAYGVMMAFGPALTMEGALIRF